MQRRRRIGSKYIVLLFQIFYMLIRVSRRKNVEICRKDVMIWWLRSKRTKKDYTEQASILRRKPPCCALCCCDREYKFLATDVSARVLDNVLAKITKYSTWGYVRMFRKFQLKFKFSICMRLLVTTCRSLQPSGTESLDRVQRGY